MKTICISDKKFSIFIPSTQINQRVKFLGKQLSQCYAHKTPVFIGVLNGSFMFMASLLKNINTACETSFIKVSSYKGGTQTTGFVQELLGLDINLKNRHVIIVEDIIDTGKTLQFLLSKIKTQQPASLCVVALLLKPEALQQPITEIKHVGFEIKNHFFVGYGMDYNGLGRNLKDIYTLEIK